MVVVGILIDTLLIVGGTFFLVKQSWQTMPLWQRLYVFIGAPIILLALLLLDIRPNVLRGPRVVVYLGTGIVTVAMIWGVAVYELQRRYSASGKSRDFPR
jgi:hypothetical protein